MAVTTDQMYAVFQNIDSTLKAILIHLRGNAPAVVANAADLDGQWGDPIVKTKDPRDWNGESQLGKPFSECPPVYLDLVASRLDFFAEKAEAENTLTSSGKPVAPFNRRDAARARGWAARLRNGWKPPASDAAAAFPSDSASNSGQMVEDSDIAF